MPRSMTGFGAADGPVAGGRLQVEIRTVNHRHFNPQMRLPSALQGLEGTVRERLRARIRRGHASVAMRWLEEPPEQVGTVQVDLDRARAVLAALEELRDELSVPGTVDVSFLARQPDVLRYSGGEPAPRINESEVLAVVDRALAGLVAMREHEGEVIAGDLRHRLDLLDSALDQVRARAPERLPRERDRLRALVRELLDGGKVDADRLSQEIVLTAARLDIAEEVVRLQAHLDAARKMVDGDEPSGRRLGFLAQEMLREINTMGAKANDAAIAQHVIGMKEELERFREQLENLE